VYILEDFLFIIYLFLRTVMPSQQYLAVLGVLCTQSSFLVLYFRGIMSLNRDFSIVDLVEKL